jgi:FkbM family methyltransferase
MNLQTFCDHTIDVDLLDGGVCIDAGCRGFEFSVAMRDLGLEVYAFDLEDMIAPHGIRYIKAAILDKSGEVMYVDTHDQQAKYISDEGTIKVMATTLNDLYNIIGDNIDVLKMDVEGSEYFVFSDSEFQPIPKQISLEFHRHSQPKIHAKYYLRCMTNILKDYSIIQHEYYQAHGCGFSYWDSLFIRKDLI